MTKGLGLHHSPYGHIETVAQASAGVTGVWCKRNADPPPPSHTGEGRYPGHRSRPIRKDPT